MSADAKGTVVITDREAIAGFMRIRRASALGLEIITGMRNSRGSVMMLMGSECGSAKRTKAGVLQDYIVWMAAEHGQQLDACWGTVGKALGETKAAALRKKVDKAIAKRVKEEVNV